jgi:alpha-D-ribose 1-methylphosphonate 5-triphosphate diphosphatase
MPRSVAFVDADLVLPDRVLPRAALVVRDGRIVEIAASAAALRTACEHEVDARGAYLMPGLVDLHNDGLELEINPRPRTNLPLPLAFANCERRLIAAGVTTEFHAISFMDQAASARTATGAADRAAYVAHLQASGRAAVDHQVLHRVDVWSPDYLDLVFESTRRLAVRYLTLNDHTPGQGQFRDLARQVERLRDYAAMRGAAEPDRAEMERKIAARAADRQTVPAVYERVRSEAAAQGIVVGSHDDDSAAKVDALRALGASVAEFPITLAAARHARARGMSIVVGAPNVVRGGSQSGNLDARELVAAGLADAICADYHAPSLLPAAFRLVREGLADLPAAARMVTLNPARAVGQADRGALAPGLRADLILVRVEGEVPHVEAAYARGRPVFQFAAQEVPAHV